MAQASDLFLTVLEIYTELLLLAAALDQQPSVQGPYLS
jgi:hypothetical protein